MNNNKSYFGLNRESPLYQLLVLLFSMLFIGGCLSLFLIHTGSIIYNSDMTVFNKSVSDFNYKDICFLKYLLIIQDFSLFIVPSVIALNLMKTNQGTVLSELKTAKIMEIIIVVILSFCMFPVTSFTAQINSMIHFPDSFSGIEQWLTEKEDKADDLIRIIITSDSFFGMIINLLTVAFIPAVAEELIFRGVFQKIFHQLFRSFHFGIWITAFLFSAIHFQFFGFIPRFLLGLTFGYIYYWGGTLVLPVTMHFVNNAFPVIIGYFHGIEKLYASPDTSLLKQAIILPLPILAGSLILIYFMIKFRKKNRLTAGGED